MSTSIAMLFTIGPAGGSYTIRFLGGGLVILTLLALAGLWRRRRRLAAAAGAGAILVVAVWIGLYLWRPRWLQLALADPRGVPDAGALIWSERAAGLETAELTVRLHGESVDTIALVRVDLSRYELSVHWDGEQPRSVEAWGRALDAAVVINGSYFEPDLRPSTPLRIARRDVGPEGYLSEHGAIVIGDAVDILDLRGRPVRAALAPYRDGMVSYPLLVDPEGRSRARGHDDWFANRVFVGIDASSRLVIGMTRTGFFSLPRLGQFLLRSPLALRVALNLDGGPLASQLVDVPGWRRVVHGNAEITGGGDLLRLAHQAWRVHRGHTTPLPIVLSVRRRR